MTSSYRLHNYGVRSSRRPFRNEYEYDAACTFRWRCSTCGSFMQTPPPQTYAEDDFDEPPECCGIPMAPAEQGARP